jgi:hypothetical protein
MNKLEIENDILLNSDEVKELYADNMDSHMEHIYSHKDLISNNQLMYSPMKLERLMKHVQNHIDKMKESHE